MTGNTRFSMAVHLMTALAYSDSRASSEELSETAQTNPVVVRRLLGDLKRAGLIHADRGKSGGFTLAREASRINLLDIYRAVSVQQALLPLHDNPKNRICTVSCKVRDVLSRHLNRAQNEYERELEKVLLADIVSDM